MGKIKNAIIGSIVASILYSHSALASECVEPVQPIEQGAIAPCKGFLFSPSEEEIAYKATQIASLQKEEISILQERLNNYKTEADTLSKQLASKTNNDQIWRAVYFVAGVGITALAVRSIRP